MPRYRVDAGRDSCIEEHSFSKVDCRVKPKAGTSGRVYGSVYSHVIMYGGGTSKKEDSSRVRDTGCERSRNERLRGFNYNICFLFYYLNQ